MKWPVWTIRWLRTLHIIHCKRLRGKTTPSYPIWISPNSHHKTQPSWFAWALPIRCQWRWAEGERAAPEVASVSYVVLEVMLLACMLVWSVVLHLFSIWFRNASCTTDWNIMFLHGHLLVDRHIPAFRYVHEVISLVVLFTQVRILTHRCSVCRDFRWPWDQKPFTV